MKWYPPKAKKHGEASIADVKRFLNRLKSSTPCADCGNKYPHYVMDYDHIRSGKVSSVSQMLNGKYTLEQIGDEIAKCELVCSNCHRERTSRRHRERKLATI